MSNPQEQSSFDIDEDEDVFQLLEDAAKQGSIATENEAKNPTTDSDEIDIDAIISGAPAATQIEENLGIPAFDEVPAAEEAVVKTQSPVTIPVVAPPTSRTDDVEFARKVIAAVDVFRNLPPGPKAVVAQLLAFSAGSDDGSEDEGTVAVRAVNAEGIHKAVQNSLVKAKELSAVDRAFYLLDLPEETFRSLVDLVEAYTRSPMPKDISKNDTAKALVLAIEGMGDEPLVYAEAMSSVLDAAQNANS